VSSIDAYHIFTTWQQEADVSFKVYDFREDIRNLLVTPQIRTRFLRIEVGELSGGPAVDQGHSHDLGVEAFLVLQGQAEFWVEGETQVLGPGQACFTLLDEVHTVRNVGDEPVILYLSVSPHIEPTHTRWAKEGEREAPHFYASTVYDVPPDRETPTEQLLDRQLAAFEDVFDKIEAAREVLRQQGAAFKRALSKGDTRATRDARDAMWGALFVALRQVFDWSDLWNDFAYRTADSETW
jgi:mannose-6-phosphate isomerase-like protein (cupin superfamily)